MPKSIIDIDVNDEQFKKFLELYDQFQSKLEDVPESWSKVNKESKAAFDIIGAAMLAQNALLVHSLKGQKDLGNESERTATAWERLSRSTRNVADHIVGGAKALLRWTSAATIVSGLLGAGSLFGIDRLGHGVAAGRRSSQGMGVSFGQQKSFDLNFGRFVDAGSVLGSVSTGLFDVTSPEYLALLKAGISPQMLARGNAADIGAELLKKIPQTFGNVPSNQRGLLANTLGFGQLGIGGEEINRYLAASPEEREKQQRSYRENAQGLDLTGGQQRAWTDLVTQLHRAGQVIENTFVKGLTPLLPGIEKLSEGFANAVKVFLGSEVVKKGMDLLGQGLDWLGKYMASPAFMKDVEDFAKAIGKMASAVVSALRYFSLIPGAESDARAAGKTEDGRWRADIPHDNSRSYGSGIPMGPGDGPDPTTGASPRWKPKKTWFDRWIEGSDNDNASVPEGLLNRVRYAETGDNPNQTSPKGAQGPYQFMPKTWEQYGKGGDPFDPKDSRGAAKWYLEDLTKQFSGDMRKAVAAYNWGPGNVERDVKQHGDDWEGHLPKETKDYLAKVLGGAPSSVRDQVPKPRPSITVNNNTGGSAVITGSQVAI